MEDILENPRNFSCLFSTSHIRVHLKNAILVACSSSSTTVRYNKCSSMAVTETATAPFSLSYFNKVQKLAQFYHSKNGTLKNSFLINVPKIQPNKSQVEGSVDSNPNLFYYKIRKKNFSLQKRYTLKYFSKT